MAYVRAKTKKETRALIGKFIGKRAFPSTGPQPKKREYTYPTFPKIEFKKIR